MGIIQNPSHELMLIATEATWVCGALLCDAGHEQHPSTTMGCPKLVPALCNVIAPRDYREAEIRHGRLAMLAAILWPLQEIIDRLFIPQSFGHTTMIYGGATLPFVSLFMTFTMLLLEYLDIYAGSIKGNESGDTFLPGECFWDPLSMLVGAPDAMKRKMQERELNNGRIAMVAVFSYIVQEAITHQPVINLPWNQILFEPAFEIPEDGQFAGSSNTIDFGDTINDYIIPIDEVD